MILRRSCRRTQIVQPRRWRLILWAICLTFVAAVAQFEGSSPAFASGPSSQACYSAPSDATCSGATIDVGVLSSDPCFNDSYSLTYEYGYTGANFAWSDPHDPGWTFETWLDYSPACQSNFTYTEVTHIGAGVYQASNKIRRASGPDGGYLMEHGQWEWVYLGERIGSPLVYSPHNTAESCLSIGWPTSDDQVKCTYGGPNNNGYY